jgi:hypothetical protein
MASRSHQGAGSSASRSPLKWILPAVIVLVIAVFAVALIGEDNAHGPSSVRSNSKPPQGPPATEKSSNGRITSGGTDLFAVGKGGLGKLDGKPVTARRVSVQTVKGQGLWVGTSASERVFVKPSGGSVKGLQIGQRVDLQGTVRKTPAKTSGLGLRGEDLRQVQLQGGYVSASTLKRSK